MSVLQKEYIRQGKTPQWSKIKRNAIKIQKDRDFRLKTRTKQQRIAAQKDDDLKLVLKLIFGLIVFCAVLTWFIPGGEFERETLVVNGVERSVIKADSFHYIESEKQTWQIFSSFFEEFIDDDKPVRERVIFTEILHDLQVELQIVYIV